VLHAAAALLHDADPAALLHHPNAPALLHPADASAASAEPSRLL
jgi:hypothetical protein